MSWRDIERAMEEADVVLEVIDSRFPDITRSRKLEKMTKERGKNLVIAMNKVDLVPRDVAERWIWRISKEFPVVPVSARKRLGTMRLRRFLKRYSPAVVLIAGFPKVGKSSIINVLKGRHSASTSPVPRSPGYTKGFTKYRIEKGLYIIDSPGIIPPEGSGFEAVVRGGKADLVDMASSLILTASKISPGLLKRAYGVAEESPEEVLSAIARKRGFIFKSTGELNLSEAAKVLLEDFYRGKISFFMIPEKTP
ncbi:MAG: GTP-binding protein [Thermoproteota archaeon]|jgi:ribosome biogenesis GTPase A|uniref:GTPase RsgA n=1 Tax=Candidatus Methanodesulfokora washburnensis TaxID=2478471 RepID=A0A520KP27_9CREN|nr:MAG: GTPase RsgA [Candidatus Methanodesulfokores washburnensis]TDA41249.1 MAG: GTP-binding protein [Candidatus Korarchaeota archaeon]